jgi:hypothetical protein
MTDVKYQLLVVPAGSRPYAHGASSLWHNHYPKFPSDITLTRMRKKFPDADFHVLKWTRARLGNWSADTTRDSVKIEFCASCGGLLDTGTADMWTCKSCGDEWNNPEYYADQP